MSRIITRKQKTGHEIIRGSSQKRNPIPLWHLAQIATSRPALIQDEISTAQERELLPTLGGDDLGGEDEWALRESILEITDDDQDLTDLDESDAVHAAIHPTDIGTEASLELERGDLLVLRVSGAAPRCVYEPAPGIHSREPHVQAYIDKLNALLRALADYLTTEKPQFLRSITPESFAAGETDFDSPVVTQKGLLARLNARMRKTRWHDSSFTRTVSRIWLVWPDTCVPVTELFAKEMHLAWVVEGCLQRLPAGDWSLTRQDLGPVKRTRRGDLRRGAAVAGSQREILTALCARVAIDPGMALDVIHMRAKHAQVQA